MTKGSAQRSAQLFSLVVMLLLVTSVAGLARFSSPAQTTKLPKSASDATLKEIVNYRQWTRVNETPRRSNTFFIDGADG